MDDLADEVCDADRQEHIGVVSAVVSRLHVHGDLQNKDILVPREVGGEVPRPHVRNSAHYDQQIIRIQYTMAAEVGVVSSAQV